MAMPVRCATFSTHADVDRAVADGRILPGDATEVHRFMDFAADVAAGMSRAEAYALNYPDPDADS